MKYLGQNNNNNNNQIKLKSVIVTGYAVIQLDFWCPQRTVVSVRHNTASSCLAVHLHVHWAYAVHY